MRLRQSYTLKEEPPGQIVFMRGQWWWKITPPWVKGYRPATIYRPLGEGLSRLLIPT